MKKFLWHAPERSTIFLEDLSEASNDDSFSGDLNSTTLETVYTDTTVLIPIVKASTQTVKNPATTDILNFSTQQTILIQKMDILIAIEIPDDYSAVRSNGNFCVSTTWKEEMTSKFNGLVKKLKSKPISNTIIVFFNNRSSYRKVYDTIESVPTFRMVDYLFQRDWNKYAARGSYTSYFSVGCLLDLFFKNGDRDQMKQAYFFKLPFIHGGKQKPYNPFSMRKNIRRYKKSYKIYGDFLGNCADEASKLRLEKIKRVFSLDEF